MHKKVRATRFDLFINISRIVGISRRTSFISSHKCILMHYQDLGSWANFSGIRDHTLPCFGDQGSQFWDKKMGTLAKKYALFCSFKFEKYW